MATNNLIHSFHRGFARNARSLRATFTNTSETTIPYNPFKLDPKLKQEIKDYYDKRLIQVTNFIDYVQQYENFIDGNSGNPNYPSMPKSEMHPLKGFCTPEGCQKFKQRGQGKYLDENFISPYNSDLSLSLLAHGSSSGNPSMKCDFRHYNSLKHSLISGAINHIDTGNHFRVQKSERVIGELLKTLVYKYDFDRSEIFINTKIGTLEGDIHEDAPVELQLQEYIQDFQLEKEDFSSDGYYSLHPVVLNHQIERSLKKLNVMTLDCVLLELPYERFRTQFNKEIFQKNLAKAFLLFERCVQKNIIKSYGIVMNESISFKPHKTGLTKGKDTSYREQQIFETLGIAEKIGGSNHNFKYLQVPLNLYKKDSVTQNNQILEDRMLTVADLCAELKLNILTYQPLLQAYLIDTSITNKVYGMNNGARHIQLVKSLNKEAIKGIAIGMNSLDNMEKNLHLMSLGKNEEELVKRYYKERATNNFDMNMKQMSEVFRI